MIIPFFYKKKQIHLFQPHLFQIVIAMVEKSSINSKFITTKIFTKFFLDAIHNGLPKNEIVINNIHDYLWQEFERDP